VPACRAARLRSTVAFLQIFQDTSKSTVAGLLPVQQYSEARTDLPRPLGAFSFIMIVSGAIHPILHGANTPLPFLSQLLFHTAYLLLLVVSSARTAAAVLQWSHYHPEILGFCKQLNSLATFGLGGMGVISDAELLDQECHAHASMLLVLFAYFYIGFVLPVYVAYRLEQHLKQQLKQELLMQQQQQLQHHRQQQLRQHQQERDLRYWQQQQQQQRWQQQQQQQQQADPLPPAAYSLLAVDAGGGEASVPGADMLVLLFSAVTCWGLVLMLHPLLSMLMWAEAADLLPQVPT
jgi:hypothetical protein